MPTHLRDLLMMTVDVNDGGTDSRSAHWSGGGSTTLTGLAPGVAKAFATLVGVRPAGVTDELLGDPAVAAFAEQFRVDVSLIDEPLRSRFADATGHHHDAVAVMVWIGDVAPRLRSALDTLFGPSEWTSARRYPVADVWTAVENFTASVARLEALDATITELIRLRGARQHDCRICRSRRSAVALSDGADEATFDAVDHYRTSELSGSAKAALALVDAMIWTPAAIPDDVVAGVGQHLSEAQAVEVVLDVGRNAANKIAVALGADAPEVTEGVQLFVTDADGVLTTV
jgi:alkylhydroperoxidase family enzyme